LVVHERVWDALVGVDWHSGPMGGASRRVVRELQDVFLLWMEEVPADGRRLAGSLRGWLDVQRQRCDFLHFAWLVGLVRVEERT